MTAKVTRDVFFIFIGFGSCIIVMSMVKKLFRRKKSKNEKMNNSVASATLKELSEEGLLNSPILKRPSDTTTTSDLTKSVSSTSENSDPTMSKEVKQTRRKLNSTLRKYRKSERKLQKMKRDVSQMENEMDSLIKSIKHNEANAHTLQEELNSKRLEVLSLSVSITPEMETDIKKRECLCYKRYTNIKTITDAHAVYTMIKQRQEALKNLEILTFKKYWSILHKSESTNGNAETPAGVIRSGLENWFRKFQRTVTTASPVNIESSVDDEPVPTAGEEDVNQTFTPLLESNV